MIIPLAFYRAALAKQVLMLCITASNSWRWGGCSDNIKMGEQYAVRVLDSLETGQDAQAVANLHNNFAGRLVRSASFICCPVS